MLTKKHDDFFVESLQDQEAKPEPESLGESEPFETRVESLKEALDLCRGAANEGYGVANVNFHAARKRLLDIQKNVTQSLSVLENESIKADDLVGRLRNQLREFSTSLGTAYSRFGNAIQEKYANLSCFSITLFGRTVAGKSTLMEILTNGSGASIGKGAQRTTRDIRNYHWNGLYVTDVPGIAAFDGAEDEKLAYQSASQADLVLFLITDDAPQPSEARCAASIIQLGKPVIGVCNVKQTIDNEDDREIFLKRHESVFDACRLKDIFDQFHQFTNQYLPGNRISFFPCHLRARFLASSEPNKDIKKALLHVSRFEKVESAIIEQIKSNGVFWRYRAFIDSVAVLINEFAEKMIRNRYEVISLKKVVDSKKKQFSFWCRDFERCSRAKISAFVSSQNERVRRLIPNFAEEFYNASNVGERWEATLNRLDIPKAAREFQEKLQEECLETIRQIAKEVFSEMKFVEQFVCSERISTEEITDYKKNLNWGAALLGGGLTIASIVLASTPLGWAAAAVGVIAGPVGWLFEDKEQKVKKARRELEEKLVRSADRAISDLQEKLNKWFNVDIKARLLLQIETSLQSAIVCLGQLVQAQDCVATDLLTWLNTLNKAVIEHGLSSLKVSTDRNRVSHRLARIPGVATMVAVASGGPPLGPLKDDLEKALGEKLFVIIDNESKKSIIAQALGSNQDASRLAVDETNCVAKIVVKNREGEFLTRLRLAQQMTGLYISEMK